MGKEILTEKKAKSTPQGGVLVGKRKGQTIIHDAGTQGGYFVGKLHSEGGIKGINKTTGQPIEVQGGEVIITAPAVADQTKRNFNGEMLTNREILSKINEKGGGVSFADGGDIPSEVYFNGTSYEFGGESLSDYEIMRKMNDCGCEDEYEDGGEVEKALNDLEKARSVNFWNEPEFQGESYFFDKDGEPNSFVSLQEDDISKTILAYDEDGQLVGVFRIRTSGDLKGAFKIVVREDAMRKGWGKKLLDEAEKQNIDIVGNVKNNSFSSRGRDLLRSWLNEKSKKYEIGGYNAKTIWDFKNTKEGMDYVDEEIVDKAVGIYVGGKASKVDANELKLKKGGGVDLIKEDVKTKVPRDFSPNTYDDIVDVHTDGITGGETGFELGEAVGGADASFEDGGDLDFLDEAVQKFDDGGSTKEVVEYIKIWSAGSSLSNLYGETYENYKDLKKALAEINPTYSYIYLAPNGKSIGGAIDVKKGGKNTVKTINPNTATAKDFEKVIKRSWGEWRMDKYDLSKWLSGDEKGKSKHKPQPKPEPQPEPKKEEVKEATKIDFEATKKYLTIRIADLTKELNFKKPRLSNEEIGFYQRDINNLIEKLRISNEKELSVLPIKDRLESAYSLKWGNINAEFTPSKDLLAPNGLPTKLTDEEWVNVRSPYFSSFFGDWRLANEIGDFSGVSKVIDPETKEPMPVYHGTNVLFTEWKTYKTNNAHYFAKNRDFSEWFAEQWEKGRSDVSARDSNLLKTLNPDKGTYLYRCFLDIKNPIDFSRFGVEKRPVSDFILFLKINYNIGDFDFWTNFTLFNNLTQDTLVYSWMIIRNWQSFTEYIKMATTYDGYIFYEYHPEKVGTGLDGASLSFCAFDSSQIKFTNATEFNALITDSRFEQGGKL